MRRDKQLQIEILRDVRDETGNAFSEVPPQELLYNIHLLEEDGLITGSVYKDHTGDFCHAKVRGLTSAGHDYLEEHEEQPNEMKVFISHSSKDRELAASLISLLRLALQLPDSEIRCTSVDGYRLEVGTKTRETLRREIVEDSEGFIALITPSSLLSSYVLVELGARWGVNRPLWPVCVKGVSGGEIPAPLDDFTGLDLTERAQVLQLVSNLAKHLKLTAASAESYSSNVEEVIEAARVEELGNELSKDEKVFRPSKIGVELLRWLESADGDVTTSTVAGLLKLSPTRARTELLRLLNAGFVDNPYSILGEDHWALGIEGLEYLERLEEGD